MKQVMKKRMVRILSALFAITMVAAFLPQMVSAASKVNKFEVKITFRVVGGAWNDGTIKDRVVILSRDIDEDLALCLKDGQIPEAGAKPFYGYKAGSWSQDPTDRYSEEHGQVPTTARMFSKDTVYTYTYEKKENIEISEPLLATIKSKGSNSLVLSWNKVDKAEGYDIFFSKCNDKSEKRVVKKVKTIKGNKTFKWTKKGLKKKTSYKASVKAYVMKNGKKQYIKNSPLVHGYTSGGNDKYTNIKSVTVSKKSISLAKGKSYKIKVKVKKLQKKKKLMPTSHAAKLRYISSEKKVATVSKSGMITAKADGTCVIYAIAANGVKAAVKVTVLN